MSHFFEAVVAKINGFHSKFRHGEVPKWLKGSVC
jgi:hypothetical protein